MATTRASNGGGNLTFNSPNISGPNPIIHIAVVSGNLTLGIPNDTTAVTVGGVSATKIDELQVNNTGSGVGRYVSVWELVAPATGVSSIVVTSTSSDYTGATAISHSGAKQSAQPDSSAHNRNSNFSTLDFTTTTVADNSWGLLFVVSQGNRPTAGANCTKRGVDSNPDTFSSNGHPDVFDTNGPKTPAGSLTMTINGVTTVFAAGVMVSIAPFSGNSIAYPADPVISATTGASLLNFI